MKHIKYILMSVYREVRASVINGAKMKGNKTNIQNLKMRSQDWRGNCVPQSET